MKINIGDIDMPYLHKLKIGNVELENNIILAPMAGVTDLPFRIICKKYAWIIIGIIYIIKLIEE